MMESREAEFFVGYRALPRRTKRFVLAVAAFGLLLLLALGALAATLRDPAPSTALRAVTLRGRLEARGYGLLWTELDGVLTPVLIAGGGKFGAPAAAKQLFGHDVEAEGLLLTREGYHMLELGKIRAQALPRSLALTLAEVRSEMHGSRTLEGEIVDIKCWLGRMKPGDGRTHRACAQFCIQGGIPPVLITRTGGTLREYVLTDQAGAPINDVVLPFVAEAVRVEGTAEQVGSLWFLRIDPRRIRRL